MSSSPPAVQYKGMRRFHLFSSGFLLFCAQQLGGKRANGRVAQTDSGKGQTLWQLQLHTYRRITHLQHTVATYT